MKTIGGIVISIVSWCFLAIVPFPVAAEPVVTAVIGEPKNEVKPSYFIPGGDDQGYIAISVRVTLPNGLTCVTPTNLMKSDNFFVKNNLEIVLFATVEGFENIDPKQPIPITAYKFDDEQGKYCAAPFTLPVTLVPNHRFGRRGPTGASQPKITITMAYTAKGQELVTPLVLGWIDVAASVATGGASQTVVGLSNIASSKAVGALATLYNSRSTGRAEQKFSVDLPWSTLISGPALTTISFYEGSSKFGESLENAIQRIRNAPTATGTKTLFNIQLAYEYRRSLFLEDTDFSAATKQPVIDSRLSSANVLNFPAKGAAATTIFPNLMQIIGKNAPSIQQGILTGDASKCNDIFVTLRNLGLNAFDRAIVVDALFDGGKLRNDKKFVNDCFSSEQAAFETLVAAYGKQRYPVTPIIVDPSLVPLAGTNVEIDAAIRNRMYDIRSALSVKLGAEDKAATIKSAFGSAVSLGWGGDFSTATAPLDVQIAAIAKLDVKASSCMFRMSDDVGAANEYRVYMALRLGTGTSGGNSETPYFVVLDFDAAKPHALRGLQFYSSASDDRAISHFNYLKQFSYDANSSCPKIWL